MKKTLITGITGQDGAYPDEFLIKKDYIVHGSLNNADYLRENGFFVGNNHLDLTR